MSKDDISPVFSVSLIINKHFCELFDTLLPQTTFESCFRSNNIMRISITTAFHDFGDTVFQRVKKL